MQKKELKKESVKLLCCPFCGGEARINSDPEAVRDTEGHLWAFTVGCSKCCATSGLCCSPDKAIEAWNTRKPMEAVVAELEKEYDLADKEIAQCMRENILQYDEANGYARGIDTAIEIVRGKE